MTDDIAISNASLARAERVIARQVASASEKGIAEQQIRLEDFGLSDDSAEPFVSCGEWLDTERILCVADHARTLGGQADGSVMNPTHTPRGIAIPGRGVDMGEGSVRLPGSASSVGEGTTSYARAGNVTGGLIAAFARSKGPSQ